MTQAYFIPPSTIVYGNTPNGVAFTANLYSMETRELVGTVNNDGTGGGTYFRPDYSDNSKADTYKTVEEHANSQAAYSELYYERLMDIAENVVKTA